MIASHNYLCGSAIAPMPATYACFQAGCTAYAFCCGRKTCDCVAMHKKHAMILIEDTLEEAMKPVGLGKEIVHSQKEIGMTLDELGKAVEQLKDKHNAYVEQFANSRTFNGPLRTKLAQKAPLNRDEATGESFHTLMNEE